jgi:hypothetical protein
MGRGWLYGIMGEALGWVYDGVGGGGMVPL